MTLTAQLRAHAIAAQPNEACGFVMLPASGNGIYAQAAKNTAQNTELHFRIGAGEYLAAKKTGRLVAFYHTHNTGSSALTEPDIPSSEETGVPMLVYDLPSDTIQSHVPLAARRKPVERRFYLPTVYDCVSLVTDYFLQKWGLEMPPVRRSLIHTSIEVSENMVDYASTYGFGVVSNPEIRTHDVIVMGLGSPTPNHMGVIVRPTQMLHHLANKYSGVDVYGGYFEKSTMYVLRHSSLI